MKKIYNYYLEKKHGRLEKLKEHVINERIREKYSLSGELAILRQRDTKPEEFAEYHAFAERVKAEVAAECEAYIAKYEAMFGALPEEEEA